MLSMMIINGTDRGNGACMSKNGSDCDLLFTNTLYNDDLSVIQLNSQW
jgi:hypothetical protein